MEGGGQSGINVHLSIGIREGWTGCNDGVYYRHIDLWKGHREGGAKDGCQEAVIKSGGGHGGQDVICSLLEDVQCVRVSKGAAFRFFRVQPVPGTRDTDKGGSVTVGSLVGVENKPWECVVIMVLQVGKGGI